MFSYEDDILPWLNQCMKLCTHESTLYYSLFQYSQCLKDLLNLMNEEYKKAIIDIATDDKNVKSVLALYKNEHRIKKRIIDDFVDIPKLVGNIFLNYIRELSQCFYLP